MTSPLSEVGLLPAISDPSCLEDAAVDIICRIPNPARRSELLPRPLFNRDQAEMLARRLGLDGGEPCTLQEAAELKGVTRERVRQLQLKLDQWRQQGGRQPDEVVPAVLRAAITVAAATPSEELGVELRRQGLAREIWTLARLVDLLHLCARDDLNELLADTTNRRDAAQLISEIGVRAVWEQSGKSGFAQVTSVTRAIRSRLGGASVSIPDEKLEHLLLSAPGVLSLSHGYLFGAPHDDPTIVETAKRMLAACERLPLRDVRAGLRRRCRFRQIPFNLPLASLRDFFSLHASFEIDDEDYVRATGNQAPSDEDTIQTWIVNEIRGSDYGMLTRHQVMQRARNARHNTNTVSIYLTYGEQIVHDRRGFFHAIGRPPDESIVEIALDVADAVVRDTSQSWKFDASTNTLTALIELGDGALASGVVFADDQSKGYLDLLMGRPYGITDDDGESFGNIRVSERMSALTGLSTFFAHTFPEPGDLLQLRIDLDAGVARAEIGGSELDTEAH
jgi:hypothetical protein